MGTPKRHITGRSSSAKDAELSSLRDSTKKTQSRDGLAVYLASPASFPSSRVLYHTPDFVVIHDLYPKSSIHLLLLPRTALSTTHPIAAFDRDPALLAACRAEAAKAITLVASELRRRFSRYSAQDRARCDAMEHLEPRAPGEGDEPAEGQLPTGRHWEREILVGVHAGPSMVSLLLLHGFLRSSIDPIEPSSCACAESRSGFAVPAAP